MNKTNINKKYKNKNILKYSIYILIFIIILFILYKYKFRENFELTTITNYQNKTINNDNNKCYIICKKTEYKYMEDYILSFYKKLNAEILIFDNINDLPEINKTDIFIFIQNIPDEILTKINNDNNNIYLLNTEQMSRISHKDRIYTFPKNIRMLDYSKSNLKFFDGYYTKFLSYQINYDEIYNLPKTKDICIMSGESQYRRNIINEITNKGYTVDIISGWKKERDEKLFTYKILLNISYQEDYRIFESIRCDRCIFNKMIVISDKKEDMDLYYLKQYMIFEDYDKVANKAIEVLNNYDMYYKKLGLDTLDLNTLQVEPVTL